MANEEAWETSSGLALDGLTGPIVSAEFGFNANMGAGITCLNLTLTDDDGEEVEQSFSVGGKFEANRDGSAIEGSGKINKNSNMGLLIESIKEVVDNPGDVIGDPKQAENWVGLIFTWGSIEREVVNPTTKEKKLSTKFVVVEYHGRDDGEEEEAPAKTTRASGAKKPAAKPAARGAAAKKSNGIPDGIEEELWAELLELAGEHEEHGDFAAAALDLAEVEGNKAAQKAVMGTKAGSVWAAREG